jgi:hypothetical protein
VITVSGTKRVSEQAERRRAIQPVCLSYHPQEPTVDVSVERRSQYPNKCPSKLDDDVPSSLSRTTRRSRWQMSDVNINRRSSRREIDTYESSSGLAGGDMILYRGPDRRMSGLNGCVPSSPYYTACLKKASSIIALYDIIAYERRSRLDSTRPDGCLSKRVVEVVEVPGQGQLWRPRYMQVKFPIGVKAI